LIVLRYRLPDHHRLFWLPLSIGRMPLLPLLAIGSICLLLANFEFGVYFAGATVFMLTSINFLLRGTGHAKIPQIDRNPASGRTCRGFSAYAVNGP
jgi:APA family basic amino acid/polyamine antiporter